MALLVLAPLLAPRHLAWLQCAMCARTMEGQAAERTRALLEGVAVLGIPPLLILGAILYLAWKRGA